MVANAAVTLSCSWLYCFDHPTIWVILRQY